jgi:hypothetical protein
MRFVRKNGGGETLMQFLVMLRVFDSIVGAEDLRVRKEIAPKIQKILPSGKVMASGSFAGIRGGFFLIDVDTPEDIYLLLGNAVINNFHVKVKGPIMPFEQLGDMFNKLG